MRNCRALLLAALAAALLVTAYGYDQQPQTGEGGEGGSQRREGTERFLLQDSQRVVRTDAGEMRVMRGYGDRFVKSPMHIGFITMEPQSLFVPQYLDSSLILFVRRGEATVGNIYNDELVERTLKMGDIYRIGAGSAFYLVNKAEGQRLHIICSIVTAESIGTVHPFHSFYIGGGGQYPTSILAGFDHKTMSTALNVSEELLTEFLTSQNQGPIVTFSGSHSPRGWAKFLHMDPEQKLAHMKRIVRVEGGDFKTDEQQQQTWSFRKLLGSILGSANWGKDDKDNNKEKKKETGKGPDSYNLYDRKPDFKNDYGWSMALDDNDYEPLKHDNVGVYLVTLTAGSMMAPHINPRASEYGIVLKGCGTVEIVNPNGTLAMNAKVCEGEVFWVPRYHPFCQISSRTEPFEFFGFTTFSGNNWPQFLVGQNSLLQILSGGPEFAAGFGQSEEWMKRIINAQNESRILPATSVSPPGLAMM